jgi:protein involved in polysaccharide export with SLBB domain
MFKNLMVALVAVLIPFCQLGVSQEHKIGPGDTLYIVVWGYDEYSGPAPVSPDGTIALPLIGIVQVEGLTTEEIGELLTEKFSEFLRNPQVTVSLREFGYNVHIYGEVVEPGYYKVPDKTTLQEVISRAGGLTPYADTEHIRITSFKEDGSRKVHEVNFYKFLKENDESANPFVMSDDLIFVPRLKTEDYLGKIISVLGSVQKPGVFDLDEERSLMDVISLAGGFTVDADLEKVSVVDLAPDGYKVQMVNVKRYLQENDPSGNPIVRPRMAIYVPSTRIPEELTYPINVVGQVLRPGVYRVKAEKARVLDAVFSAGGFAQGADIENVTVISDQGRTKRLNLKKFLITSDMSQNPRLNEGDTVIVPVSPLAKQLSVVDTAFVSYKTVSVIGEVRNPGTFQIPIHANLLDLLIIAGGTTSTADLERVTLIREAREGTKFEIDVKRVLTEGEFNLIPELRSGDTVFIPQQRESIWRQVVRLAADLSTIAALILILMGRR